MNNGLIYKINVMKKIMIGSQVISLTYPDYYREPNDMDYLVKEKPDDWNSKKIDLHENSVLWSYIRNNKERVSIETLYTLKCSHIFWDINWKKHMRDIKYLNSKDIELDEVLYNQLIPHWENLHGKRRTPNFDSDNEEFFNDNVDREFEHDELHKIVAYPKDTVFDKIKEDKYRAEVSEHLFYDLPEEEKIRMVKEEAYVLALERYILNDNKLMPKVVAYKRMMKKLLMGLTPLWLAKWMTLNFEKLDNPDRKFVEKFHHNKEKLYGKTKQTTGIT